MLHLVSEYDPVLDGFESRFGIDLNSALIPHPNSTYIVQMQGEELVESHINNGDYLIIDRSIKTSTLHLAMIALNGEHVARWYEHTNKQHRLYTINTKKNPRVLTPEDVFEYFGAVTNVLRVVIPWHK